MPSRRGWRGNGREGLQGTDLVLFFFVEDDVVDVDVGVILLERHGVGANRHLEEGGADLDITGHFELEERP